MPGPTMPFPIPVRVPSGPQRFNMPTQPHGDAPLPTAPPTLMPGS